MQGIKSKNYSHKHNKEIGDWHTFRNTPKLKSELKAEVSEEILKWHSHSLSLSAEL